MPAVTSLPHQNFAPVSVVVPCYQCARTIERAIYSVVAQTLLPQEVILIDDASQDGTWRALQNLATQYPGWIRIFRMEHNQGAASTRNVGWGRVTQPYIAFLDSDDSWHPEKIKLQFGYMHKHPHVGLSGHLYTWSNDESHSVLVSNAFEVSEISARALMLKSYFPTPSVMVKSDVTLRFRKSQRHSEDALLWQELALLGVEVVRLEAPLAKLYKAPYGDGGLSAQLWAMECAELNNFRIHYKNKNTSIGLLIIAILLSVVKFLRRLLLSAIHAGVRK